MDVISFFFDDIIKNTLNEFEFDDENYYFVVIGDNAVKNIIQNANLEKWKLVVLNKKNNINFNYLSSKSSVDSIENNIHKFVNLLVKNLNEYYNDEYDFLNEKLEQRNIRIMKLYEYKMAETEDINVFYHEKNGKHKIKLRYIRLSDEIEFTVTLFSIFLLNPFSSDINLRNKIQFMIDRSETFDGNIIPFYNDKIKYATLPYILYENYYESLKHIKDEKFKKYNGYFMSIIKELNRPTTLKKYVFY